MSRVTCSSYVNPFFSLFGRKIFSLKNLFVIHIDSHVIHRDVFQRSCKAGVIFQPEISRKNRWQSDQIGTVRYLINLMSTNTTIGWNMLKFKVVRKQKSSFSKVNIHRSYLFYCRGSTYVTSRPTVSL